MRKVYHESISAILTMLQGIKLLINESYARMNDTELAREIKNEHYDIQTAQGAVILPSTWSAIVKPDMTITLKLRASDVNRFDTEDRASSQQYRSRTATPDNSNGPKSATTQSDNSESEKDQNSERYSSSESGSDQTAEVEILNLNTTEDEDSGSVSPTENESDTASDADDFHLPRNVVPPRDTDGNILSFKIDTSKGQDSPTQKETDGQNELAPLANNGSIESIQTLRITKAMLVDMDNKSVLKVHTLPGPETIRLRDSVNLTWHHLPARTFDFAQYRNACLGIPNLSERLKRLTVEMLNKIETHKVKRFLEGFFVEAGTVLRADETCQPDPKSVIFSCVPYYALEPLSKRPSTGLGDRVFPARSLMQTFYPYEPVRDRDIEQAYRKYGDDRQKRVVHVPNMWIMNIGPSIVFTCGQYPITDEMVNSIEIVREDISRLGVRDVHNALTNIRLQDWYGCTNVLPLNACQSYFQLEQKLKELRNATRNSKSLRVMWKSPEGEKLVTPQHWHDMVKRTDLVFIDLVCLDIKKANALNEAAKPDLLKSLTVLSPLNQVPPLFHWPQSIQVTEDKDDRSLIGSDVQRSIRNLELVEKDILSATLDEFETINEVDKSFASTAFYQSLPEDSYDHVSKLFGSLKPDLSESNPPKKPQHNAIVKDQCNKIAGHAIIFCKIVHETVVLFVRDDQQSTVLRKLWGAMAQVYDLVQKAQQLGFSDAEPPNNMQSWWIRDPGEIHVISTPIIDKRIKRAIGRCRRCARPFSNSNEASIHLQRHLDRIIGSTKEGEAIYQEGSLGAAEKFTEWIIDDAQLRHEESNAGMLAIVKLGCEESHHLFVQAKELLEGVQNEDGQMSDLYTFPAQLIEAFRRLIVFYLAIERSLHYTVVSYKDTDYNEGPLPFSEEGLERLKWFSNGADRLITAARNELCTMTAEEVQPNIMANISLSSEYVCGWLIRRLFVKPLDKHMAIGDMYREYLSTIVSHNKQPHFRSGANILQQFQVNHRPGKRLIRSINLVHEELQILAAINTSQIRLLKNYLQVLNDATYEKEVLARRGMYHFERALLISCLDHLALAREDYDELISHCGPLADKTKQSLEINEEDHGKAIMVFTTVTIIFLPLSFVTSYLGMNTADIRDMDNQQGLFWVIAIPLTVFTMASAMLIGYNGDELRDLAESVYRKITGKQTLPSTTRSIGVAQRKRARKLQSDTTSLSDYGSLTEEAEYTNPQTDFFTIDDTSIFRRQPTVPLGSHAPLRSRHEKRASFSQTGRVHHRYPRSPSPQIIYNTARLPSELKPTTRLDGRTRFAEPSIAPARYDPPPLRTSRRRMPAEWEYEREDAAAGEYTWHKKRSRKAGVRFQSGYRSMGRGRDGGGERYRGRDGRREREMMERYDELDRELRRDRGDELERELERERAAMDRLYRD